MHIVCQLVAAGVSVAATRAAHHGARMRDAISITLLGLFLPSYRHLRGRGAVDAALAICLGHVEREYAHQT